MRIIHTSDWHIGRRFEREPLEHDQRAFLGWLAQLVAERSVSLVIVAGDVYDRSMPSEEAVAVLDDGLDALLAAGACVALIPGNHDSARRLGFGARRQAAGGVHVFAEVAGGPAPWRFSTGGEDVAIVAVPFLDPLVVPAPRPGSNGAARPRTHGAVLADALEDGRRALRRSSGVPTLAVAHATVAGGWPSDSERLLAVGGADVVDPSVFAGFDYVALGHLHRPQCVGGDPRVAYSGSPLPYSFSETHPKSVRLVEVSPGETVRAEEIGVPVGRPVVTLQAELERLLHDTDLDRFAGHFVAAVLTDTTTCVQPLERLRQRFPFAVGVRYARHAPARGAQPGRDGGEGPGRSRHPDEVVFDFLAEVCAAPAEPWARGLVREAVRVATAAEAGMTP